MVSTSLFKAMLAKNKETQTELAKALGMQQSALSERINGRIEFRASEIAAIKARYRLSEQETVAIFFNEAVS